MTCRYCPQAVVRAGFCLDHLDITKRDIAVRVEAEAKAKATREAHAAFMRRLGEELRARKVHELPLGSLGWMLAGDAAWRAAIAANPGFVAGSNTCTGAILSVEKSVPGDVVSAPGTGPSRRQERHVDATTDPDPGYRVGDEVEVERDLDGWVPALIRDVRAVEWGALYAVSFRTQRGKWGSITYGASAKDMRPIVTHAGREA